MLKKSKAVSFSGRSMIDNQLVATFSANIYDTSELRNDNDNISMVVTDSALYEANKEAVRKDLQDFQNIVWAEQDKATETEDQTIKAEQDKATETDQDKATKVDQGETAKTDQNEATK